jgi:Flp pilus assembly secretin CpaC
MSSVGRFFVAVARARCWACLGLFVLLLGPQSGAARAGDAVQVQLDVLAAQVRRGLTRSFVPHFLQRPGQTITDAKGQLHPFVGVLASPGDPQGILPFLQALRDENLAKLIAEPRLVTLNGKQANFLAGGEQAVPGPAGVQFQEFGLRVSLLPTVLDHGRVRLEAETEWSTPAGVTPERQTQRVHTETELKAGQAVLIGGLVFQEAAAKGKAKEEVELVVLVTPSLVSPASDPAPQPSRPTPGPHGQGGAKAPGKGAAERMQRLERRLHRLQEEMDDLRRELRSLRTGDSADQDQE